MAIHVRKLWLLAVVPTLVGVSALVTARPGEGQEQSATTPAGARAAGVEFKGGPPTSHARALIEQVAQSRTYRGSTVEPLPGSTKIAVAVQREIAAAFIRLDPVPDDRLDHFAWLEELEEKAATRVIGWNYAIKEVAPIPGGWRVGVRVVPQLGSERGVAFASDYIDEVYDYTAGHLQFVQAIGRPMAIPRVVTFN